MASKSVQELAPDRLRPWHEHVAQMFILNPNLTQREIARQLGRSEYWLSIIVNSDAFQNYLAERKAELDIDPILMAEVSDRMTAVANAASEKFLERLSLGAVSNKELLGAMNVSTKALGMGPTSQTPAIQQNLYVIPAPARPASSAEWVEMAQEVQRPEGPGGPK